MATTYTTNYNLGKQENHADKFDMDVITDNADKIDAALTGLQSGIDGKQATLTTAQLAAVNSGITSTDVEQIETNKNNISFLTPALVECVDNEKKNYLYYTLDILKALNTNGTWMGNAYTHSSGVTFTINSDMSISVSGTNNSGSDCAFLLMSTGYTGDVRMIPAGTYIVSGCPTGGSNSTYLLFFWKGKTTSPLASYSEYGDSTTVYLDYTNASTESPNIAFIVKTNNTVNFTVYPMICKPDAWTVSHKYVPYAMSNSEITAWILAHS